MQSTLLIMRAAVASLGLALILFSVQETIADECRATGPVLIHSGFMTGVECKDLSEGESQIYMMGVVNGIFLSPLYGAQDACISRLRDCLEGKTNYQLGATFKKYINEHPESWHEGCHNLAYKALLKLCPRAK